MEENNVILSTISALDTAEINLYLIIKTKSSKQDIIRINKSQINKEQPK